MLPELLSDIGALSFSNYLIAIAGGVIVGAVCLNWFDKAHWRLKLRRKSTSIQDQLLMLAPHSLLLSDMAVFGRFRRNGVGSRLLEAALEKARILSSCRIVLMVDSDNEPALELYRKFGFSRKAERSRQNSGRADAVQAGSPSLMLMAKTLGD